MRKPIEYRKELDYVVGTLRNGTEFKVDLEDYERIKDFSCYPNGTQISICINKKCFQLGNFIMSAYCDITHKCFFRTDDVYDFRKSNLYCGNDYVDCGTHYIVYDNKRRSFEIDYDDYVLVSPYMWHVDKNGYVISSRGNGGRALKMHRLLLGVSDDYSKEVDHVNRITTDNRRSNLRIASRSENCINRLIDTYNKSGKVGVYKSKGFDKWCAQINYDGKRIYLGSFETFKEAVSARIQAEERYHKEFRPIN